MMIRSLFNKVTDYILPNSKPSDNNIEQIWQNYIDGTIGRGVYYLYQDALKEYFTSFNADRRALSLGCGAGNEEVDLVKNGWEVTAIDSHKRSEEVINQRVKAQQNQLHFQLGDFSNVNMTGYYNLVLALFSLPFGRKEELINLIAKLAEHTRPGSLIIANFFGNDHSFVKKSMAYAMSLAEITELFNRNNFKMSYILNRKFKQLDFSGNKTDWELIDIIAIKS